MYAFPKITKVISIILIIHGIGFLLTIIFPEIAFQLFALSSSPESSVFNISFIWKIFTYPIIGNSNIIGLLFFGLFMWWVGSRLEEAWGMKLFLRFYLVTVALSGVIIYLLLLLFGIPQYYNSLGYIYTLNGVIGITFSIIAVYAYMAPNLQFYIFGIFPIKVKWLLLISIILTFASGSRAGAVYIAENLIIQIVTGLVAVSFVFITQPLPTWIIPYAKGLKDWVEDKKSVFVKAQKEKQFKVYTNKNYKNEKDVEDETDINNEEQVKAEVDRILDKISKYGIDTLTKKEKDFLDKAGQQYKSSDDDD